MFQKSLKGNSSDFIHEGQLPHHGEVCSFSENSCYLSSWGSFVKSDKVSLDDVIRVGDKFMTKYLSYKLKRVFKICRHLPGKEGLTKRVKLLVALWEIMIEIIGVWLILLWVLKCKDSLEDFRVHLKFLSEQRKKTCCGTSSQTFLEFFTSSFLEKWVWTSKPSCTKSIQVVKL